MKVKISAMVDYPEPILSYIKKYNQSLLWMSWARSWPGWVRKTVHVRRKQGVSHVLAASQYVAICFFKSCWLLISLLILGGLLAFAKRLCDNCLVGYQPNSARSTKERKSLPCRFYQCWQVRKNFHLRDGYVKSFIFEAREFLIFSAYWGYVVKVENLQQRRRWRVFTTPSTL